jgi:hypothetical protein
VHFEASIYREFIIWRASPDFIGPFDKVAAKRLPLKGSTYNEIASASSLLSSSALPC